MYASSAIKAYLNRKAHNGTPGIMDWPPQSPDLKMIVAVWDHLYRAWNKVQPATKEEFGKRNRLIYILKNVQISVSGRFKRLLF